MSFKTCILAHGGKGFLTEKQALDLVTEYEKLLKKYKRTLGDEAAAHQAADHITRATSALIMKRTENEINHVLALKRVKGEINGEAAKIGAEKDNAYKGTKWLHGNSYTRAVRDKLERTYERQMSLEREAMIEISDIVESYRSKAGGFKQDIEGFTNVVREAMGENTGDGAARAHGQAVRKVLDRLRDDYEKHGGVMGKIENYFPAHHEAELVGKVPFEEWSNYLKDRLDRERMVDLDTGLPMNDDKLAKLMRNAYDNIKTHGLVDVAERAAEGLQTFGGGGEVNMRRSQSRFFHFKDANSYLEYNAKFGKGDEGLFSAMMGHISAMTRDIAIMQHLGPKPTAVMKNIELELQARGVTAAPLRAVQGMYDVLSGKNMHSGELSPMYKFMMGWLNVKRSAYLGSAPISALSDTFYISAAAKMNGLPAAKVMGQYLKLLNPADSTDRDVARHLFYVASAANGMGLQGARFADDVGRGGKTAFLAGVTNRVSGLAHMTDAARQAPMMVHGATMARYVDAGTKWDDLEKGIQQAAMRYGIGKKDWNNGILKSKLTTHPDMEGTSWLMPENFTDRALGQKYNDWMVAIGQLATNEPKLLTRAITSGAVIGSAPQGSLLRLMAANVFFAKSFPITIVLNQLLPALRSASQGRLGHLAALAVGSTVMGALTIQLRDVIKGQQPRATDNPKFWLGAMMQGGGAGLFSDFLFADYNRFQQSMGGMAAGPIVGTVQSLLRAGDLYGVAEGDWDFKNFASDVFKVGTREIPGINLWYSRLVVERMFLDQVEKAIDPRYDSRISRLERQMRKQTHQGFWWRPGQLTPQN